MTTNLNGQLTCSTPFISGATYQWLYCPDYTPIPGATSSGYIPSQNGNYAVIVTTACGSDTSECLIENGLLQSNFGSLVQLNPNPTSQEFNLEVPAELVNASFAIYDCTGRVLMEGRVFSKIQTINIEEFAAGTYYFVIREFNVTQRIVKE